VGRGSFRGLLRPFYVLLNDYAAACGAHVHASPQRHSAPQAQAEAGAGAVAV
jgi:hypothetical protein